MKTSWNFAPLTKDSSDQSLKKELKRVRAAGKKLAQTWEGRTDYLSNPLVLKRALEEYAAWLYHTGPSGWAGYYIDLRTNQELDNPKLKAWETKIETAANEITASLQFLTHRLALVSPEQQKIFLTHPSLKEYRHFLERLFAEAKYLLSEAEEKILTLKWPVLHGQWIRMTEEFLAKEERLVLTDSGKKTRQTLTEIMANLSSRKRAVRQSAGEAVTDLCQTHAATAEYELNAILQNKQIDDRLRGLTRPDLVRHLNDDLESELVDLILATVSRNFRLAKRYYQLKAKILGLPKFDYYDRAIPQFQSQKNYSYETAVKLTSRALGKLDPEFAEILGRFVDQGLIDVYPKKGKPSGAFCAHGLPSQPTYIMLNHEGRLRDVTTLAHEVGHGINNELIKQKQSPLNFGTPMSTAEVASTFMEDFVLDELTADLTPLEQLNLNLDKLGDDVATIFRQVACYRFEQELHETFRERGHLSSSEINRIFKKHMASYLGPAAEKSDNWWVYWSHIRRFFYVYSYASGLLISKSLQASVKQDPKFIEKVKEFLSAGTSDSPKNIFAKLGIDLTDKKFWERGIKEFARRLTETENLAKKLGKI